MVSSPITGWQIDGETVETMRDFIFLGSKISVDGDSSYEIKNKQTNKQTKKKHLLLRIKGVTNLDSILKSGAITLPSKACLVKAMTFSVVMYGFKIWTIKIA